VEEIARALATERMFTAAILAVILFMLITEKGLWTAARGREWKERCERMEREAAESMAANTELMSELVNVVRRQNEIYDRLIDERFHR